MANIIKLGSLHLDGVHTAPGSKYLTGQAIGFNNGDDLQWVVVNGLLIADRPLLVDISWDDLNEQNLVFGKRISISGHQFLCRLLKVGTEKVVPNEWDAALDVVGDDNDLWNWYNVFCWGQERVKTSLRACRGYGSARFWDWGDSSDRTALLGFRPALVPLPSNNLISGIEVCAIGGQSILRGKLLEATQYDAIILPDSSSILADADHQNLYNKLPDGTVVLDRTSMAVQTIKEK